jgi:hypothetical protein
LIDLQNQALEKKVVILQGKAILGVVVEAVVRIFRMRKNVLTIAGHQGLLV